MELDGQPGDVQRGLGAACLGTAGGQRQAGAVAGAGQGLAQSGIGQFQLQAGVDHAVLQGLVAADGLAELHPVLQVFEGGVEGGPGQAQQLCRLQQPRGVQGLAQRQARRLATRQQGIGRQACTV